MADSPIRDMRVALRAAERALGSDDPVVMITSGSTGVAKRVQLPGAALHASATGTADRLGGHGQWLLALPVSHIAGYQVLVGSVLAGSEPVPVSGGRFTAPGFVAATDRLTGDRRYAALVPTQLHRALADAAATEALGSYDTILVGGAALSSADAERAAVAGVRIVTTYGMTETCGGCVYDGLPLRDVLVDVPADGPIRLGGPTVFTGYEGRPDLTSAALLERDGVRWHLTNDVGRLVAGRLEVLGRADDVIMTGGYKVAPSAVEAALSGLPDIAEAVVVGVSDPEWGQRVVAVVVAADSARPPTLEATRDRLRGDLPAYALPQELCVVAALPLLASGKPDRAAATERAAGRGTAR